MLPKLQKGDTIGLASPSWIVTKEWAAPIISSLENMGYNVKCAKNIFSKGWGYAASPEERADDLNELIADKSVRMVFFGGGEGADDVIPLLDYSAAKADPKLYLSYSDGTSILNAIWACTGITTLYGQMPGLMPGISEYNKSQFVSFTENVPSDHVPNSEWHTLTAGTAEGTLIGGYLSNFIFLVSTGHIPLDRKYVLFIEDHEKFNGIESESALIGRLEQCGIMQCTTGLLFGHYSDPINNYLLERLRRLGEKWNIPVAYCDDFGHGANHAILPIGANAVLNTEKGTLNYRL